MYDPCRLSLTNPRGLYRAHRMTMDAYEKNDVSCQVGYS
jgi:hypothetical protein